ncbi:MAG: VOC family protein [Actinobacteria bacterium]|jgi:catechol 2,3-dioxygenase-like lactoylglutathione lyase family enzyme|nr:VOC family protein [Actinomycetota bacterium]
MTTPIIKSFDNIDILYTDIEVMYEFYHHTLGLPLLFPRQPDDNWFAIQVGAVTLYFFPGVGEHATPFHPDSDFNPPGIESATFAVDNLDDAIAAFDGKVNWISEEERWEHPSGTWYRFRFFLDPEGNKLSITETHKNV